VPALPSAVWFFAQVQQLVRQLQGKYKWLGVATSPVVFVGVVWLLLRVLRLSSA